MGKITTVLLCLVVAFAAFGVGMVPGLDIKILKIAWYIAGISLGIWIGAALNAGGLVYR